MLSTEPKDLTYLCHSIKDGEIIYGLNNIIEHMGYMIYVDWDVDRHLYRSRVDKRTAPILKYRMRNW